MIKLKHGGILETSTPPCKIQANMLLLEIEAKVQHHATSLDIFRVL